MNNFCLCCKEICKEAKIHNYINNSFQVDSLLRIYPKRIKGTLCPDAEELAGKCCMECYVDIKKFEFEWELEKLEAQYIYDQQYEASKEQAYCGCEKC